MALCLKGCAIPARRKTMIIQEILDAAAKANSELRTVRADIAKLRREENEILNHLNKLKTSYDKAIDEFVGNNTPLGTDWSKLI